MMLDQPFPGLTSTGHFWRVRQLTGPARTGPVAEVLSRRNLPEYLIRRMIEFGRDVDQSYTEA